MLKRTVEMASVVTLGGGVGAFVVDPLVRFRDAVTFPDSEIAQRNLDSIQYQGDEPGVHLDHLFDPTNSVGLGFYAIILGLMLLLVSTQMEKKA